MRSCTCEKKRCLLKGPGRKNGVNFGARSASAEGDRKNPIIRPCQIVFFRHFSYCKKCAHGFPERRRHNATPGHMDDKSYHRLLNSCIDHVIKVLGPRLDEWAKGKTGRWKSWATDEKAVREEGRAHWQVRHVASRQRLETTTKSMMHPSRQACYSGGVHHKVQCSIKPTPCASTSPHMAISRTHKSIINHSKRSPHDLSLVSSVSLNVCVGFAAFCRDDGDLHTSFFLCSLSVCLRWASLYLVR